MCARSSNGLCLSPLLLERESGRSARLEPRQGPRARCPSREMSTAARERRGIPAELDAPATPRAGAESKRAASDSGMLTKPPPRSGSRAEYTCPLTSGARRQSTSALDSGKQSIRRGREWRAATAGLVWRPSPAAAHAATLGPSSSLSHVFLIDSRDSWRSIFSSTNAPIGKQLFFQKENGGTAPPRLTWGWHRTFSRSLAASLRTRALQRT